MELGWIDFSKTERNKVLGILDLLQEPGTLDELGIAPIRDGFSDIFFPGTSTIQTRAKYFFIIPYILKDLERSREANPNALRSLLDALERSCGEEMLAANGAEQGIIGARSLQHGRWVKRPPSEIYWNGLRQYRIFLGKGSLTEYLRHAAAQKIRRFEGKALGNRNDNDEEKECDDKDAGIGGGLRFWNIPTYSANWKEQLQLRLSPREAAFLKGQMIERYPDSLLAYILKENMQDLLRCESFAELSVYLNRFPPQIRRDYGMALDFSRFLFLLRVVYNILVSGGKNEAANSAYALLRPRLAAEAHVDLDAIITRLGIGANLPLCRFLHSTKEQILRGDYEGLCRCIRDREIFLKGSGRAKTANAGKFDPKIWYGGTYPDYRFSNAKVILQDIFEGEVAEHAEP